MSKELKRFLICFIAAVVIGLGFTALVRGQGYSRFYFESTSQIGHSDYVTVVKDVISRKCYAVYRSYGGNGGHNVTNLGEVPCANNP